MEKKNRNEFEPYLNECQTYVWEWYIPEQKVRFGIPSLHGLWLNEQDKNIKLSTMLERVHPDDIQKVLVRHTSPLYKSDKMFEVDLRLNVAAELTPDGQSTGAYEWYGFRGKTVRRDSNGRPVYVRGIAINLDSRYRAQLKLIAQKDRQLQHARQMADSSAGVLREVSSFIRQLADETTSLILASTETKERENRLVRLTEIKEQAMYLLQQADHFVAHNEATDSTSLSTVRPLALWEHLAERQQVYALRGGAHVRFYFSNLYDDLQIQIDVKVFDLLLDNVVEVMLSAQQTGYLSLCYEADRISGVLRLVVKQHSSPATRNGEASSNAVSTFGFSVGRIAAQRLGGDICLTYDEQGDVSCHITLPLDTEASAYEPQPTPPPATSPSHPSLPRVLIGMRAEDTLYTHQHLFEVEVQHTTHDIAEACRRLPPDIVFLDYTLTGSLTPLDLVAQIHQQHPDIPIIVVHNYALRSLHREVRANGARYLLTAPLTLRKVNMMVKKYLK